MIYTDASATLSGHRIKVLLSDKKIFKSFLNNSFSGKIVCNSDGLEKENMWHGCSWVHHFSYKADDIYNFSYLEMNECATNLTSHCKGSVYIEQLEQ